MSDLERPPESSEPAGESVQETEESAQPAALIQHRDDMEWYVVHTYSGFEKKVQESLRQRVEAFDIVDEFGDILIPTEDVVEMKGGRKVVAQKKYFPGYVLVQMKMTDNTWHLVKNTPKVTGFVGGNQQRPVSISRAELDDIVARVSHSADRPKPKFEIQKGDTMRITDGPFTNFTGVVEEVNEVRHTLKLMVTIFGRATPVELDFLQVEKG